MTDLILTTFDWVPEAPRGYVRDIRVRWALEEAGLPDRVDSVPFRDRGAEHFSHQPFGQVPWLTDGDGVFMALMDAYGLSFVLVQVWGALWGFLSLGLIIGGSIVVWKGLGKNPLRTLLLANIVMWSVTTVFAIQASILQRSN